MQRSHGDTDAVGHGRERHGSRLPAGVGRRPLQQVSALIRRNVTERRRTKGTTFCELCSPILLLGVLVYGYSLSDVLVFPEEIYSSVDLELPGGFIGLLPFARVHSQDFANASLSSLGSGLSEGPEPDGDGGLSFHDVEDVFEDMTGLLDGPFPVPDLDQFIRLGSAVAGDLGDGAYAQILNSMESGWTFGNIITQGTLHFAPAADPTVGELVKWLSNTSTTFDDLTHRVHESEDAAIAYALDHLEERTWAVIALDEAADGKVDYTIRMNFTVVPNTNTIVDMIAIGLDPSFRSYYLSGFLTLQTTLDRFMFEHALPPATEDSSVRRSRREDRPEGTVCVPPDVVGVPFPTAAYDQNLFYAAVGYLLGLAMTMSTMYPLSRLVKGIVEEKESRVRETMRIMGLRAWTHELSWVVTGVVIFTFIATSVAALLSWTFLPLADGSLILVFMLSFTCSEVGMALLVSSLFSKAKLASIAAPCVLFAGVLPRYIFYGSNRHEAPRSKKLASLLSPTAFTFGADFIADYEYADIGAGWGNYSDGEYSLQTSITMMFMDAVLYSALAWYLDKVVPAEYGSSQNPLRHVMRLLRALPGTASQTWRRVFTRTVGWSTVDTEGSYDTNRCDSHEEEAKLSATSDVDDRGRGTEGDPGDFEALEDDDHGDRGVIISRLRKEFGDKVAVAGLDLRLRMGDITCLLGHNGAGKSTTISMLTGQLQATSGDALVSGHSIRESLHKVRENIGICPQHDALMPLLTAREHIEMYMDIKGMCHKLKGPLVRKTLREVGLLEKEHTQSMNLSGGQKRKLSVALALIGSPTLCILDEPTSGMDPYSRRFTWDLLRRGRAGRCTLLSTHFMEEAEHLGDRVAMLRKGRLRCLGSPLFLKSRFGLGYKITLVKAGAAFDSEELGALVRDHVSVAEILSSAGGEVSFRLPREESSNFPALFRELERRRESMGIGGYGISITSLEEVFLSLESEGRLKDTERKPDASTGARGSAVYENGDHDGERSARQGLRQRRGACRADHDVNGVKRQDSSRGTDHTHGIEMQSMNASTVCEPRGGVPDDADKERRGQGASTTRRKGNGGGLTMDEEERAALLAEGQQDHEESPHTPHGADGAGAGDSPAPMRVTGGDGLLTGKGASLWEQWCWLLWKRRVVAMRDWKGGLYQVALPALLVALVLILLTIDVGLAGPSLAMSAAMFGHSTQVLYVEGGGPGNATYASVAEESGMWTRLQSGDGSGLAMPTSSGLSRFMLDTYSNDGETSSAADDGADGWRPPRYGAFVFGDRIPLNVTVDWDAVRQRPELLAAALEEASERLPADGGEYDVKGLLAAMGVDEHEIARLILEGSAPGADAEGDRRNDTLGFLDPATNGSAVVIDGGKDLLDALNITGLTQTNLTEAWLRFVDEDPTIDFTSAEYLRETSELKLEGVVLTLHVNGDVQTVDAGEVKISVDDILRALPPGTRRYDRQMLPLNPNATTVMFNTTAPHALPAWVGELTAKTFEACARQRGIEEGQASYTTRSHPLPLTATESLEVQTMLSLFVSLLVTIPLCYAPAAFVTFLVRERACKSKRVQLVSGASPLAYWTSSYVWDSLLFFGLTVLVMLAFAAYGKDASKVFMMHWDALLGTWGLLLSYGLSALPLSYLYSFAFDGPSAAQISIAGINFLSGFGFVIAYAVLSSLKKTAKFAGKAQHFFRLFPPYLLGDGLLKVSSEFYMREVLGRDRSWGVLAWDVAGQAICYMCLEAFFYLAAVLVLEYSLAAGARAKVDRLRLSLGGWSDQDLAAMLASSRGPDEDPDVKEERLRVDRAMARARGGEARTAHELEHGTDAAIADTADTVLIRGLTKVYPAPVSSAQQRPKCAVRGMNLGVGRGECFGLLGINGAGKSTTLQILTRDLQPTSGNLTIAGKPITSGAVCRLLGYCPQTDPLLPLMTVNETLLLFAGLKGIGSDLRGSASSPGHRRASGRRSALQTAATRAMSAVSLGPTENQRAGTLSGGNKRKLSLAVAIIGEPPVLLLDEPSSGMDPGARRSMWEVITALSARRSVILTTHSMEECEAVCDRLGIMVGGRLRCIGTSQHLKGRFGGGYSIEVRCPNSSMGDVTEMVKSLSSLARLEEMHPTLAKFSIPARDDGQILSPSGPSEARRMFNGKSPYAGLSLSKAFDTIEAKKDALQLWDYSISQATLETIFMSFAKKQEEETVSVPGVTYAGDADGDDSDRGGRAASTRERRGRSGRSGRSASPSDIEMGPMRDRHEQGGTTSEGSGHADETAPLSGRR